MRQLNDEQKYLLEEFAWLTANGEHPERAAERLGCQLATLERWQCWVAAARRQTA